MHNIRPTHLGLVACSYNIVGAVALIIMLCITVQKCRVYSPYACVFGSHPFTTLHVYIPRDCESVIFNEIHIMKNACFSL